MPRVRMWIAGFLYVSIVWTLLGVGTCAAQGQATTGAEPRATLRTSLETITDTELLDHVKFLADDAREGREAGKAGGQAAGDYLIDQIQSLGLKPGGPNNQYVQTFRGGMRNILAILPGSDPELAKETVVVGAHYDHVGFGGRGNPAPGTAVRNGANDNASGTAGVLEIAEAMSQLPRAPRRSVLFALWDGEEKGMLGSRHYIQNPTVDLDGIVLAIAVDMIGRIDEEHFVIWGTGTAVGLRALIARNNVVPKLDLEFRVFNLTLSDHQPFFMKNIPAILPSSGLFPELHRPTDDVELINPDGMRRASQLICGLVHELANQDDRLEFAEVSKSEADRNPSRTADPPSPRRDDTGFQFGFTCQREPREPNAVIVVQVATDTPAALAGLQSADRIFGVNGADISQLDPALSDLGDMTKTVSLSIERNGRFHTLTLDPHAGTPRVPGPFEPTGITHAWSDVSTVLPSGDTAAIKTPDNVDPEDDAVDGSVVLGYTNRGFPRIAFSVDGQLLATVIHAAPGSLLRLWNLSDREPAPAVLHADAQRQIDSIRFSEDGHRMVTVSRWLGIRDANVVARQLQLFDLTDGSSVARLCQLDKPAVNSLRYYTNRNWIGSNSSDGLRLWNLAAEQPLDTPIFIRSSRIGRRTTVPSTSLSDDGRWLITGTELIDVETHRGETLEIATSRASGPTVGLFSPGGHWALVGNRLFDLSGPDPLQQPIELPLPATTTTAQFSPDGHYLVTVAGTKATIWNVTQDNPVNEPQDVASSVAQPSTPAASRFGARLSTLKPQFTSDSRQLLLTAYSGTIKIVDLDSGSVKDLASASKKSLKQTLLSRNGRWLVVSDRQGVHFWDLDKLLEDAQPVKLLGAAPRNQARTLISSPDGRWLAISRESPVRLWDLTADNLADSAIELPEAESQFASFSPDSRRLITTPFPRSTGRAPNEKEQVDAWLQAWNLQAENIADTARRLPGHKGWATVSGFSSDGQWLVTCGSRVARLWNLARN